MTRNQTLSIHRRMTLTGLAALAAAMASPGAARAQEAGDEFVNARPVWENARGGAVSARRPGRMVQAGTARFRDAHDAAIAHALAGPEITEVAPPIDEGSALRAELITGLFDGINNTLAVIGAAIGAGLGLDDDGVDDGPSGPDLSDLLGVITGRGGSTEAAPDPNPE